MQHKIWISNSTDNQKLHTKFILGFGVIVYLAISLLSLDGRSISVAKDWKGNGKKARFLKAVASSACQAFRVSVSPDGDANHWNHLHWDMGIYRSCK